MMCRGVRFTELHRLIKEKNINKLLFQDSPCRNCTRNERLLVKTQGLGNSSDKIMTRFTQSYKQYCPFTNSDVTKYQSSSHCKQRLFKLSHTRMSRVYLCYLNKQTNKKLSIILKENFVYSGIKSVLLLNKKVLIIWVRY